MTKNIYNIYCDKKCVHRYFTHRSWPGVSDGVHVNQSQERRAWILTNWELEIFTLMREMSEQSGSFITGFLVNIFVLYRLLWELFQLLDQHSIFQQLRQKVSTLGQMSVSVVSLWARSSWEVSLLFPRNRAMFWLPIPHDGNKFSILPQDRGEYFAVTYLWKRSIFTHLEFWVLYTASISELCEETLLKSFTGACAA